MKQVLEFQVSVSFLGVVKRRGFALVSVLVVMILIMVVAVGMVTLSSNESRVAQADRYKLEADANARMGLMLAISRLQETLGKDQRVSAEADILDTSGFAGWDRAESKKHLVGVYSTEKWAERDGSGHFGYWRPYEKNRNKDAFMTWLVSGDSQQVESLDFAKSETDQDKSIAMFAAGTLGSTVSESEHVYAPVVEIHKEDKLAGRYAWMVLDEGVKANLVPNVKSSSAFGTNYQQRLNLMSQNVTGIHAVEGFDGVEVDDNDSGRLLSKDQLDLLGGGNPGDEAVKSGYFDVTVHSRSVLSDVLKGGLKRDLSLAFELPDSKANDSAANWEYSLNDSDSPDDRHTHYTNIWEFNNSGDQTSQWRHSRMNASGYRPYWWSKKMGYVFSYPEGGSGADRMGNKRYLRGPSWDLLRSYYRLYKRELEGQAASHRDRRGVKSPSDSRTWLARPYEPYSFRTDSLGNTLLSHTYVGESLTIGGGYASDSLWDPFYSYADAVSNGSRPWNNLAYRSYGLTPVITKFTLVLSIYTEPYNGRKRLSLCVDAIGNVWNPYNVPVETEALFTQMNLDGLKWTLECKRATGGTEQWASEPGKSGYAADRAFPFKHIRIGVANTVSGQSRPSSNLVLMPGEVRTFALDFGSPKPYSYVSLTTEPGSFTNNWSGGYRLYHSDKWLLDSGDTLKFILKPNDASRSTFSSFLGYFETLPGGAYNPFDTNTNGELIDQPEMASLHINKSSDMFVDNDFEVSVSNFPVGADNKKAIAAIEFSRPAGDEAGYGIATQLDPRSITNHSKAMEKSLGIPESWKARISKVSDFDLLQNGVGSRNNGFWGSSHDGSGEMHVVYYNVPDSPLVSLGGFQSCQLASQGWAAPYAIGSSFPHPQIGLNQVVDEVQQDGFENIFYDMAYLSNAELWDRYFMSGLYLDGKYDESSGDAALKEAELKMQQFVDSNGHEGLANQRLSLAPEAYNKGDNLISQLTHYRWMARNLLLGGGFNVNSTRKEAWKAWLSSIYKKEIATVNKVNGQLTSTTTGSNAAFSRLSVPAGGAGEEWAGYVELSDQEIDKLAEAIVDQVKLRGPFLSVGDFVNRRLTTDKTGELGALEAAIEKSLGTGEYGSGNQRGVTGKIRQSDVLASLGGALVARSDTFVIRAYGESVDPATGKVRAKSWCEAVVQRTPELVDDPDHLLDMPNPDYDRGKDPAGMDAYIPNDDVSSASLKYGRRFQIVSFRWLNNDEI